MTMIQEDRSVGVIPVYHTQEQLALFCIVRESDGHWGFPKGHKDEGESDEQTARRELEEETGIQDVQIDLRHTFEEEYFFVRDDNRVHKHKVVKYFVGHVNSTEHSTPASFKSEIPEVRWLSYE